MERPAWEALAQSLSLPQVIGKLNTALARWSDLITRLQRLHVRSVTAATTLTEDDDVLLVDTTGGAVTVNLPPVAGTRGKVYWVKKTNAGANNVTLTDNASDLIDGAGTLAWNTQWMAKGIVSTGTTWMLLSGS